jgi:hypothetical protein
MVPDQLGQKVFVTLSQSIEGHDSDCLSPQLWQKV